MAPVPNRPTFFDANEDEEDEFAINTREFYLTADFDQNLNLLQKQRCLRNGAQTDLLQIRSTTFIGQQITSINQSKQVQHAELSQ